MNEITRWLLVPATRLYNLTPLQLSRRMCGDMYKHHLSTDMMNYEEDLELPVQQRLHAEEVARPDLPRMGRQ